MKIQVTLKSGAQIEFHCDEWTTSRDLVTWKNTSGYPRLVNLDVDQIAAVVRLTA